MIWGEAPRRRDERAAGAVLSAMAGLPGFLPPPVTRFQPPPRGLRFAAADGRVLMKLPWVLLLIGFRPLLVFPICDRPIGGRSIEMYAAKLGCCRHYAGIGA